MTTQQTLGTWHGKEGDRIEIRGWVHHKRSSGKIRFLTIRDGSGFVQSVWVKGECSDEAFDLADRCAQETSVTVSGVVRVDARQKFGYEITGLTLEAHHFAQNYPISPKEHGVEFLMENRHLWIRTPKQWATLRIRSELIFSIHEFFRDRGFVHFDAPILSSSSCEGTSNLFETEYFEQSAYLSQSGQLYGEAGAMAFGKIYTFGPTFRAEKSKTRKHLTEFWMIEPEMAFADLRQNMALGEEFIKAIVAKIRVRCERELRILERDQTFLDSFEKPFPQISYDEALLVLEKRGCPIPWGEDFGAPHETALGEEFGVPVWVHHMPAPIKAFYFKQSQEVFGPAAKECNGRYALGCDLIAPSGYGEIIGGGEREADLATLEKRIAEHGLSQADYQWYLDLRKFGSVPHAGFGLGLERTVAMIAGSEHIRESIPFPRMMQHLKP